MIKIGSFLTELFKKLKCQRFLGHSVQQVLYQLYWLEPDASYLVSSDQNHAHRVLLWQKVSYIIIIIQKFITRT